MQNSKGTLCLIGTFSSERWLNDLFISANINGYKPHPIMWDAELPKGKYAIGVDFGRGEDFSVAHSVRIDGDKLIAVVRVFRYSYSNSNN